MAYCSSGYIFGPLNSRRFGRSLGIDVSGGKKQCNFDCLYCELGKSKKVSSYSDIVSPQVIINELRSVIVDLKNIDVITISANGEPTLYPYLNEIIDEVNVLKIGINAKSLILSNSSMIINNQIRQILNKFDIVKLSLDSATESGFKKLDRPIENIKIDEIIEGMIAFSQEFKGELVVEVLFIKNIKR